MLLTLSYKKGFDEQQLHLNLVAASLTEGHGKRWIAQGPNCDELHRPSAVSFACMTTCNSVALRNSTDSAAFCCRELHGTSRKTGGLYESSTCENTDLTHGICVFRSRNLTENLGLRELPNPASVSPDRLNLPLSSHLLEEVVNSICLLLVCKRH